MPSDSGRPVSLPWLTVLRYPAALWVVLIHAFDTVLSQPQAVPFPMSLDRRVMTHGYMGVSFFFILSGFILAYNYPVIPSLREYFRARAARILPVYYLALLAGIPFLVLVFQQYGTPLIPISFSVLVLSQAWVPPMSSFWNGPAWTLSCEAFFYLLLPFLLGPLTRFCPASRLRLPMLLFGIWALGLFLPTWFTLKYGSDPYQSPWLFTPRGDAMQEMKLFIERFPPVRLLEFIAGILLCLGTRDVLPRISRFSPLLLTGGAAWVIGCLFFPFIFSMGTFGLPGFALLIVGAAALSFPVRPATRSLSFLLLLGNASYAVYLFHELVMNYLELVLKPFPLFLYAYGERSIWIFFGITSLLTTILGIVIYLFYEEPLRRKLARRTPSPR